MKIWLCGMIRGNRDILENSVEYILPHVDGCVFVVDNRVSEENLKWLESIKGEGQIILQKWVNDHAWTSNFVLFSDKITEGDHIIWIDETDKITKTFADDIRESIKYWNRNNVKMVFLDHPFIFQHTDYLRFQGSIHWGLSGVIGGTVNLSSINGYRKENYVINTRDTLKSAFLNPAKYWLSYGASNHCQLLYYQFGQEIYNHHERLRIQFREYCKTQGIPLDIDGFANYLIQNMGNYSDFLEAMINTEVALLDIFRLLVLKQDWKEVATNRFNWNYFKWKETGATHQKNNDGYVGIFNQYLQQAGQPQQ